MGQPEAGRAGATADPVSGRYWTASQPGWARGPSVAGAVLAAVLGVRGVITEVSQHLAGIFLRSSFLLEFFVADNMAGDFLDLAFHFLDAALD